MDKSMWVEMLLRSNLVGADEVLFAFILCQYTDKNGENCYRTIEFLSERSKRCENTTRKALNNLVKWGFLKQDLASSRYDIPKARGYVWSLIQHPITGEGATIAPSNHETAQIEPSSGEPSRREPSPRTAQPTSKQLKENNNLSIAQSVNPHAVQVSTKVLYSDTSKGGDQGKSSAPSRACAPAREETTYSSPPPSDFEPVQAEQPREQTPPAPIDRAAVAAIKQALEHALPTLELSGVKGLYGLSQQILTARGGLDEARLYIEQRGLEWTQRLLEGQRYPAYAIVRLIAKDAPSWRPAAAAKAAHPTHAAPPQATQDRALPPWWGALLKALYEAFKAHRHHDTERSREGARQLGCLLHHLSRVHDVCLEGGLLTLTIEGSGPDPDSFELASSFVLHILQNHERLPITHLLYRRASATTLLHAS